MKKLMQLLFVTGGLFLSGLLTIPFLGHAEPGGQSHEAHSSWLKPVEAQYVCMVNNQSYDSPQISVEVEGKTYYGCCPMCKTKLEKVPAMRSATDPVSGNTVDKAEAVIGTSPDRTVYYFENEENFHTYAAGLMPKADEHDSMSGMPHRN